MLFLSSNISRRKGKNNKNNKTIFCSRYRERFHLIECTTPMDNYPLPLSSFRTNHLHQRSVLKHVLHFRKPTSAVSFPTPTLQARQQVDKIQTTNGQPTQGKLRKYKKAKMYFYVPPPPPPFPSQPKPTRNNPPDDCDSAGQNKKAEISALMGGGGVGGFS